MTRPTALVAMFAASYCCALAFTAHAQQAPPTDGPQYVNGSELAFPATYREWTFLSSGLGMTYTAPGAAAPAPQFTNVFVNPSSYRRFMQTGRWPDKTIFVLESRNSASEASINKGGRFQGDRASVEAEVKDSRFGDGWAFFAFGGARSPITNAAAPLSGEAVAGCVECHTKNAAVERTFVQFYPTLMEVARRRGTIKTGF